MTRAKLEAHVSFVASRRIYNQWLSCVPSRFIEELPDAHVEITSNPGLFGGQSNFATLAAEEDATFFEMAKPGRGPGYHRLRNTRRRKDETVIEGRVEVIEQTKKIPVGVRVFHQKFGYGTVISSDGDKLEIEFEKAGTKKVVESFVKPA